MCFSFMVNALCNSILSSPDRHPWSSKPVVKIEKFSLWYNSRPSSTKIADYNFDEDIVKLANNDDEKEDKKEDKNKKAEWMIDDLTDMLQLFKQAKETRCA